MDRILIAEYSDLEGVIKALSSPLRLEIMKLLYGNKMNITKISEALKIHQSTCTVNVQLLEKAGLIKTEIVPATKGAQKLCYTTLDEVVLTLREGENLLSNTFIETEMPIGLYTDFQISPPCGLVSGKEIIGYFDAMDSFLHPHRGQARLIWFTKGWIEYKLPKKNHPNRKIKAIQFSMELCSEFPGHNADWPSDITVWINDVEIGTWTSPGDMGGSPGRLTPSWWSLQDSQYGFLKTWKVTEDRSYIDGEPCGAVRLPDLQIEKLDYYKIRIGIKEDAQNIGGLNLFGSGFGNYDHDLIFRIELESPTI